MLNWLTLLSIQLTVVSSAIMFFSSPVANFNRTLGHFIEIPEKTTFKLSCRADYGNDTTIDSFYLQNNMGFDEEFFEKNVKPESPRANIKTFTIYDAKVSDSGLYICRFSDKPVTDISSEHVYVFVRGKNFFVPKKSAYLTVSGKKIMIPCTATRNEDSVRLEMDGKPLDAVYKPTEGFRIDSSLLEFKFTTFKCIYNDESIQFFVKKLDIVTTTAPSTTRTSTSTVSSSSSSSSSSTTTLITTTSVLTTSTKVSIETTTIEIPSVNITESTAIVTHMGVFVSAAIMILIIGIAILICVFRPTRMDCGTVKFTRHEDDGDTLELQEQIPERI